MKYQTISLKRFFGVKGTIYYLAIAKVLFPPVKISSFCKKAHPVFHWCLYNKLISFLPFIAVAVVVA